MTVLLRVKAKSGLCEEGFERVWEINAFSAIIAITSEALIARRHSNSLFVLLSTLHSQPPVRIVNETLKQDWDTRRTYQAVPVIASTSTTVKAVAPLRSLGFKSCNGGGPP